jgi:hypothetical protein
VDIDKGPHCARVGMSALCENGDALAHAHQAELGKDEKQIHETFQGRYSRRLHLYVAKFQSIWVLP